MKRVKIGPRTRRYESPRRRARAATTRAALAASARRLFAGQGYAATSIETIARDAGVAVQTFYATYGSKRAVLFALLDAADAQTGVEELRRAFREHAGDPRRQVADAAAFCVRFYQENAALVAIAQSAGTAEPDLQALWREGEARRRKGEAPLVRDWAARGALREGLTPAAAADILWALTGADCHRLFVRERRWSPRRYERWLAATLETALLRPDLSDGRAGHRAPGPKGPGRHRTRPTSDRTGVG